MNWKEYLWKALIFLNNERSFKYEKYLHNFLAYVIQNIN